MSTTEAAPDTGLVLSRRAGQQIVIQAAGQVIIVELTRIRRAGNRRFDQAQIWVRAPRSVRVDRGEIHALKGRPAADVSGGPEA